MESGNEYGRHHHTGAMNEAHEGVLGHSQQVTGQFPMQIPPQADPLMPCLRVGGYCNRLAPSC